MAIQNQLVVFTLDEQLYALPLASVQRVVRMVEVTPLPNAPEVVLGVINVHGSIMPVMSMRKRFGRPEPEASLNSQLIVAETGTRSIALVVSRSLELSNGQSKRLRRQRRSYRSEIRGGHLQTGRWHCIHSQR